MNRREPAKRNGDGQARQDTSGNSLTVHAAIILNGMTRVNPIIMNHRREVRKLELPEDRMKRSDLPTSSSPRTTGMIDFSEFTDE